MNAELTWPRPDAAAPSASMDYDQLKGHFLASLSHELRTPLNGVVGMAELLLQTPLDDEQREYAQILRDCGSQLSETLNSVLDYAALSAGEFVVEESEFHVHSLLESVCADIRPRAEAKGLLLITDWERGNPETLIGDERYLRQLLLHLLRNAVKFTLEGQITLQVRFEATHATRVILHAKIIDTGIGIPPDQLKLIFQSFRQLDSGLARSFDGLGLGLAISEKITKLLRGEIRVESTPRVGSTFHVSIPFRVPAGTLGPQLLPAAVDSPALPVRLRRVLVVDDNRIAQQVVGNILRRAHYEVAFASSGNQALEMAAREQFDAVLMDLQMPELDGFATTRRLRQLPGCQHLPVFAITSAHSDRDRAFAEEMGMQGYFVRPIIKGELLDALRQHLP